MTGSNFKNIGFALKAVADQSPDSEAIVAQDLSLSHSQLWRIVQSYADCMRARGIDRRALVSVDTSDMIVSVCSIFALSLLGARFVPMSPELREAKIPKVTHFIRSAERAGLTGIEYIVLDESWSPRFRKTEANSEHFTGFSSAHDVCWILASSGTTGRPKFSAVSQEIVHRRIGSVAQDYAHGQTRLLLLFNCMTRPFVVRAVAALVSGHTIIDTRDVDFARSSGVNFVCGSVQQVTSWLGGQRLSPKIPVLQASGAKLDPRIADNFLNSFERVEDVYGSNETIKSHINVVTKGRDGLNIVGKPVAGELQIVDDAGSPCPVGISGQVRVRTDCMVDGYLGDKAATAQHFRDGWFYPGDTGVWQPRNVLQILARDGDVVNIGGDKISLGDIEGCLAGAAGIVAAGCFVNPVEGHEAGLAACVAVTDGVELGDTIRAAWRRCADRFGALKAPSIILVVPQLPQTQEGVIRRKECLQVFANTLRKGDTALLNERLFLFRAEFDG